MSSGRPRKTKVQRSMSQQLVASERSEEEESIKEVQLAVPKGSKRTRGSKMSKALKPVYKEDSEESSEEETIPKAKTKATKMDDDELSDPDEEVMLTSPGKGLSSAGRLLQKMKPQTSGAVKNVNDREEYEDRNDDTESEEEAKSKGGKRSAVRSKVVKETEPQSKVKPIHQLIANEGSDSEAREDSDDEEIIMPKGKSRGGQSGGRVGPASQKKKKRIRNNPSEHDFEAFGEIAEDKMRENEAKGLPMLSMSIVRRLMRVNPKVENISNDAVGVTAKATELFLKLLGAEAGRLTVQYNRKQVKVTDLVQGIEEQNFDFLKDAFGPKLRNVDSDEDEEADSDELGEV